MSDTEGVALLLPEADEYLQRSRRPHLTTPLDGPALQLPALPINKPLPAYSQKPGFLSPVHCRLCLQSFDEHSRDLCTPVSVGASPDDEEDVDGETDPEDDEAVHDADAGLANVDLDPRLAKHLRDEHDIHSLAEYRREVFGRVVAGWPQTIPPQVVRARLHAWKNWFTDDRFAYGVCASCARRVSAHDLVDAVFPDLADPDTPDWLGWKPSEWQQHRELWYQRMDALLCVQSYLTTYFEAPKKMQEAQRELRLAQDELEQAASETAEAKVEAAQIWLSRVEQWAEHMSQDLKSDAVLSPGGSLWLLYAPACRNGRSGPLCCRLCSICAAAFRKRNAQCAPSPELAYCCRARG